MADREKAQDAPEPAEGGEDWVHIIESSPFARCATCRNAGRIKLERGTLLCTRFDMLVDAEADEIPDDCPEYERDPRKPVPVDGTEQGEAEGAEKQPEGDGGG